MQYNAIRHSTMQFNTIQQNTFKHNILQYHTIQYDRMRYYTMQYDTTQYSTIQCDTTQYNTIPFLNSFRPTKQEARGWQTNFIEVMKNCFYVCTGTKSISTRFSFFSQVIMSGHIYGNFDH